MATNNQDNGQFNINEHFNDIIIVNISGRPRHESVYKNIVSNLHQEIEQIGFRRPHYFELSRVVI